MSLKIALKDHFVTLARVQPAQNENARIMSPSCVIIITLITTVHESLELIHETTLR
jgi:hypothetical protein